MMKKIILIISASLLFQGCATLFGNEKEVDQLEKEFAPVAVKEETAVTETGDKKAPTAPVVVVEEDEEPVTKYSELNNMAPPSDRQYKRMTRKKMEEESELYSSAGSLWKMEGQTSYLFAENKHRQEGDMTMIKLEGHSMKAVENKVSVVMDLLNQLEDQKKKAEIENQKAEDERLRLAQKKLERKIRAERIARGEIVVDPLDEQQDKLRSEEDDLLEMQAARKPAALAATGKEKDKEKEEKIDLKEVESIPSKIVEKMQDGNYRIRGQQYLTIKKKPYKLIATALVRPEDFSDAGVSSTKLMDAQYDIVHVKRSAE